jgi:hypothetical protein
MNEYVFFDAALGERFLEFARGLGLSGEGRADSIAGYVIALPDDLAEDVQQAIEAFYDDMMVEQQNLVEERDETARTVMAVWVELPDGERRAVRIAAHWARLLYAHFTPEEVNEIVGEIARGVLNPVDGPLCKS